LKIAIGVIGGLAMVVAVRPLVMWYAKRGTK
jgi:hypothetical protein